MSGTQVESGSDNPGHLEILYRVGILLTAERNHERLLETILIEARNLCHADGGTIYLKTENNALRFAIMHNTFLGIARDQSDLAANPMPEIPLTKDSTDNPNLHNVASAAANLKKTINVADSYAEPGFDFSGVRHFDQTHGYRSVSFLAVPLLDSRQNVIGVLQLINALDEQTKKPVAFSRELQRTVEALAAQAGIALENQMLLQAQKHLLESFIQLIAAAIDSKSPYTGGHCERVPVLAQMLTKSLCEVSDGPFADFTLDDEEWYELKIAAWLHDCGKIITPVHVMDKATKLETIHDRMAEVRTRFEILARDARIEMLQSLLDGGDRQTAEAQLQARLLALQHDLSLIEKSNTGGEFLSADRQQEIARIGGQPIRIQGQDQPLLSQEEIENLQISRGTLNERERLVINGHMVHTIRMLEALPFPPGLARVPEYAGGHHEKMDGTGYPRGIFAGDMSIPARAMAIADVFEALTAADRPYKPGKTLSESLGIMGQMKKHGHLDPALFDHFVSSGVYLDYARQFLPPEQIDDVAIEPLLAITPEPLSTPPEDIRRQRWQDFLPGYRDL